MEYQTYDDCPSIPRGGARTGESLVEAEQRHLVQRCSPEEEDLG